MEIEVYAVRQKSTGLFIPRLETGRQRGGSHLEPTDKREPRIFHNRLSARTFLSNWLRGIFSNEIKYSMEEVEPYLKITEQPHRRKDDMEIVKFICYEVAE